MVNILKNKKNNTYIMKDYIIRKIINKNNDNYSDHYFDKRENKLNYS